MDSSTGGNNEMTKFEKRQQYIKIINWAEARYNPERKLPITTNTSKYNSIVLAASRRYH
jgi:hypothetical protein